MGTAGIKKIDAMQLLFPIQFFVKDRGYSNSFKFWSKDPAFTALVPQLKEKRVYVHIGSETSNPTPGLLQRNALSSRRINAWLKERHDILNAEATMAYVEDDFGYSHFILIDIRKISDNG